MARRHYGACGAVSRETAPAINGGEARMGGTLLPARRQDRGPDRVLFVRKGAALVGADRRSAVRALQAERFVRARAARRRRSAATDARRAHAGARGRRAGGAG